MKQTEKSLKLNGRTLTLSTGTLANKAESAVVAKMGGSVVLATLCSQKLKEDIGYFPLSVEFEERHYAGGRISSSRFIKREGRPSENAITSGRAIDRSIRPLFPKNLEREVQIIITVLSIDHENDPALLGLLAASAAIEASTLPWDGPVAPAKIGIIDGKLTANPTNKELENSELDLLVVAKDDGVSMLEGEGKEVSHDLFKEAIAMGFDEAQPLLKLIADFAKEAGKKKLVLAEVSENTAKAKEKVQQYIHKHFIPQLEDVNFAKSLEHDWQDACIAELKEKFADDEGLDDKVFARIFEEEFRAFVRSRILEKSKRLDGRNFTQVRELSISTGILPRTHGSALFQRGETQVLTTATLGSSTLEQTIENMEGEFTKRYMHYYNMPPFASGEVKRLGSTGRREIGHGLLAEKALTPVIPKEEDFPYAIRMVSEVLTSAGSTSQASICASTLALMDAGVPIKAPVAGVAMGLITEEGWTAKKGGKYKIITDIAYTEDANGDMDFKLAGTGEGMTAVQMDIKLSSVPVKMLQEITDQAIESRMFILGAMNKVLASPRSALSKYAPQISVVQIDPSQIGQVIGGGGKVINKIIEETGAEIDIKDDGKVLIAGEPEKVAKAKLWVEGIVHEFQPGEEYDGIVKRIVTFGAFVEVLPGREGLVHISQIAPERIERVEDVLSEGQKLRVKVIEVDREGRLNLTARMGVDLAEASRSRSRDDSRNRPDRRDRSGRGGFRRR